MFESKRVRRQYSFSVAVASVLAVAAGAGATATVTGVVTGPNGLPESNVPVSLYTPSGTALGSVTTGAAGTYSFGSLPAGNYLIQENVPGQYQTNASFPNYEPTAQMTPPAGYGNTGPSNWDYTGINGAQAPATWVTAQGATPAPFESALNLTGPTVNLGQYLTLNLNNPTPTAETNRGYQVAATFPGTAASNDSVSVNGVPFYLSNIHYHNPTENIINGVAPGLMEQHMVTTSAAGGETVLATFIKIGNTPNPTLQTLFSSLNPASGTSTATSVGTTSGQTLAGSAVLANGAFNFADLLPTSEQGYFYPGSLTTPPLSTPVNWFVFATPIQMTQAEYDEYETFATAAGYAANARPVQDTAGRTFNDLTAFTVGANDTLLTQNITNGAVPEPTSLALFSMATVGIVGRRRRRLM